MIEVIYIYCIDSLSSTIENAQRIFILWASKRTCVFSVLNFSLFFDLWSPLNSGEVCGSRHAVGSMSRPKSQLLRLYLCAPPAVCVSRFLLHNAGARHLLPMGFVALTRSSADADSWILSSSLWLTTVSLFQTPLRKPSSQR